MGICLFIHIMYIYFLFLRGRGPALFLCPGAQTGVKTALGGLSFCDDALIGGGVMKHLPKSRVASFMDSPFSGPSVNDVTHLEGGGGRPFVTKGRGSIRNVTSHQNA